MKKGRMNKFIITKMALVVRIPNWYVKTGLQIGPLKLVFRIPNWYVKTGLQIGMLKPDSKLGC